MIGHPFLWSLPTIPWIPDLSSFNWFGGKNEQFSQFTHRFHWDKTCLYFELLSTLLTYKLHWNYSISCQSCQNQSSWWLCRRLTRSTTPWLIKSGQVRAIRFRRVWSVGTPAFNAECSELAHLMARMSKLYKHLNLPMPKELHRPSHFKHWSALNLNLHLWQVQLECGGCRLCHRFVRITGLLSTL